MSSTTTTTDIMVSPKHEHVMKDVELGTPRVSPNVNSSNMNGRGDRMSPSGNSNRLSLSSASDNDEVSGKSSTKKSSLNNAPSSNNVIAACGLYSFCSVSMVLVNKSLASSYNHLIEGDLNILLVVFQAVVAVVSVELCKYMKLVEYPPLNLDTAKQWAPVNIFFCLMLFTGMASLQYNSVPMVTIFKNVTNIVVTFGDWALFGSTVEYLVMAAFGIMLSGAVAAAWNDIYVSWLGMFWMALNCLSTAGYVLYMKFATKHVKLSKFGMVFYNNLLCVCFLLPVAYFMNEVSIFWSTPAIHTMDYFVKNMFAGLVGFALNFASLNCVSATGPTTYAIVGSLNKVPVSILGYLLFDNIITRQTWGFIAISMCGGFLYSYAKLASARRNGVNTKK